MIYCPTLIKRKIIVVPIGINVLGVFAIRKLFYKVAAQYRFSIGGIVFELQNCNEHYTLMFTTDGKHRICKWNMKTE
jgi:hypothetical protein